MKRLILNSTLFSIVFLGCNSINEKNGNSVKQDSIRKTIVAGPRNKKTNSPGSLIGKIYDYDPHTDKSDLPQLKGYLMSSASVVEIIKGFDDYGVSLFSKGESQLLLFDSTIRDESYKNGIGYKILDTIFFSNITDSDLVEYSGCTIDTIGAPEVIGLFRYKKQVTPKPLKAWKIDINSKRIIPTDTSHVRVYIEDDGEGD